MAVKHPMGGLALLRQDDHLSPTARHMYQPGIEIAT